MSEQTKKFHPVSVVYFLRKTLIIYLVPLIKVPFERTFPALWEALWQDAILFGFIVLLGWVFLRASSWELDDCGVLHIHWKLIFRLERTVRSEALAALTIQRSAFLRLTGASLVTLYPVGVHQKFVVRLCLRQTDAQELADRLLPVGSPNIHRPKGGERAALAFLGANSLSTLALFFLALRQTQKLLRSDTVILPLKFLDGWTARWVSTGASWLLVMAAVFWGSNFMRSFLQTVHYAVWCSDTQIGSRGGWITRFECRIRRSEISFADVRVSPAARVLRQWPVFVTAGCYAPELPLFVYRSGDEALFRELLPEFRMPPVLLADTRNRSIAFFLPAGLPLGLCLLLDILSFYMLPTLTVPLLFPTVYFLAMLCGAVVGYRREGVWLRDGRITLRWQKGLFLHSVCVLHPDVCLCSMQSPWAAAVERTNLILAFPGRVQLTVRNIPLRDARKCFEFLEQN